MNIRRVALPLAFTCLLSYWGVAGPVDGEEEVHGVLIDARCSAGLQGDPQRITSHAVTCILKCREEGLGIHTGGRFLEFDGKGAERATTILESTDRRNDVRVAVLGRISGGTIEVDSIKEID